MKQFEIPMAKSKGKLAFLAALSALVVCSSLSAQELSPEEEMARKAQDPLGDVKALMTDNTIAFNGGHNWQLKFGISYFFN